MHVITINRLLKFSVSIFLVMIFLQEVKAQVQLRSGSTTGSGGSSKSFAARGQQYYLLQSIGQSSVTGLFQNDKNILREGFIQPPMGSTILRIPPETLSVAVYPNPFTSNITITVDDLKPENLYVSLTDMNGKLVFFRKYEDSREVKLNTGSLAPSIYILKVNTVKKCFYLKMVKF
jgi:hypothetical protein